MRLDVAIVGGGPAGATAALVLVKRGYRVGVIDPGDRMKAGECISSSGANFLTLTGLEDPESEGHRRTPGMRVVWGSSKFERDYINHPAGCGWNLDRACFDAGLKARATRAGARWITGKLVDVIDAQTPFRLGCAGADGQRACLDATAVIDASGRSRAFARRVGARHVTSGALTATHTRYRGDVSDPRLLVESVEGGWWYSAGLADGLVASFQSAKPFRSVPRGPETDARLAGLTPLATHRFAAGSSRLDQMAGAGWLAIGDAAMAHDPLSGHGIIAAIASGIDSADAIQKWLGGDHTAFHRHAKRRSANWSPFVEQLSRQYANA